MLEQIIYVAISIIVLIFVSWMAYEIIYAPSNDMDENDDLNNITHI